MVELRSELISASKVIALNLIILVKILYIQVIEMNLIKQKGRLYYKDTGVSYESQELHI